MSDEELTKRNTNISKEKDNVLKAIKNVWDYETVKECLEIEINNALNLNK